MNYITKLILLSTFSVFGFYQIPPTSPPQKETTTLEKDSKDPVCGMKVKKGTSLVSIHKGKQHGFCNKMCKEKFDKEPEKYVKK